MDATVWLKISGKACRFALLWSDYAWILKIILKNGCPQGEKSVKGLEEQLNCDALSYGWNFSSMGHRCHKWRMWQFFLFHIFLEFSQLQWMFSSLCVPPRTDWELNPGPGEYEADALPMSTSLRQTVFYVIFWKRCGWAHSDPRSRFLPGAQWVDPKTIK